MTTFIILAEKILFYIILISVIYLFIFALFSLSGGKKRIKKITKKHKFVVLIPAYREDSVVMDSVNSLLKQQYPKDKLEIVVISDQMEDETNNKLMQLPVNLMIISPDSSSKAYALNFAINNLNSDDYNIAVILDADNIVENTFISDINDAYYYGARAIQAHRVAKNGEGDIAVLDAISEEINNSIFRLGHVNMGLSSALIGSGMAFDYFWFKENVKKISTAGEDKELEILLLKNGIYIEYLDYVYVYDEKTKREKVFYNQRRRWMAAQLASLKTGLKDLPAAIIRLRIDYLDKLFQWMLLPRIMLLGIIVIMSFITSFFAWRESIKWWVLLLALLFAFAMAIPDYLVTKENIKTVKKTPLLFILMVLNLFRLKGASKKFIHTEKG